MGFFKDFKNDMKQAVNELMPGDEEMVNEYDDDDMVNTLEEKPEDSYVNTMEPETASASEEPVSDGEDFSELDALEDLDIDEEDLQDEAAEETVTESPVAESTAEPDTETISETLERQEYEETVAESAQEPEEIQNTEIEEEPEMSEDKIIEMQPVQEPEKEEKVTAAVQEAESAAEEVSDSTAYITKGTRIEGNIMTDGSLDIIGTVEGDVSSYGKLIVSGVVNGKVNSSEIYANAAKITGDICSTGSVKVGVGSVIVGNIEAQSAVIAGAVNGDLDVKGPVIVDSTAVIMGNIKSRSVQINNGAVIEGFCSQCYSDIDVKSFFA